MQALSSRTNLQRRPTFSQDGKWMALQDGAQGIVVWDTATWQEAAALRADTPDICSYAFAKNARILVILYSSGKLQFWNTRTWTPDRIVTGHSRSIMFV